jgi:hypothetical protein
MSWIENALNTAAGLLQIGEILDAWHELECITPLNRAQTEVLTVRLAVYRALKDWELGIATKGPPGGFSVTGPCKSPATGRHR